MCGFVNSDGSVLGGALNPANVGQALQTDASGNLKVALANSVSAPTITEDQVRAWIANGQGFIGSTGMINSAAGTTNNPLCIFNPAVSGKNILIYSFIVSSGSAGQNGMSAFIKYVAIDPAYSSPAVVTNCSAGGPTSAIAGSCTFTSNTVTIVSTIQFVASNAPIELLTNGSALLLPSGSANGVTVYMQTYETGISGITAKWIEF